MCTTKCFGPGGGSKHKKSILELFKVCIRQNRKSLQQLTVFIPGHCKLRTYTESRNGQMLIRCGDRGNKIKPPNEVRCVDIKRIRSLSAVAFMKEIGLDAL